jgi:RHS repeat-associated protein
METQAYEKDGFGRLVRMGNRKMTYGPSGRVETVSTDAGKSTFFGYDENQIRIYKKKEGNFVEAYPHDIVLTNDNLVEPLQVGGVYLGAIVLKDGQARFEPFFADIRGSLIEPGAGLPNLPSPYGERAGARSPLSSTIDYATTGYDADLDSYRMGHRDYNPTIGQFLTPDPLFLENPEMCLKSPVECNLYGYGKGNPVSFVDPTGKAAGDVWLYKSDGSGISQGIAAFTRLTNPTAEAIYTHASTELPGGNQFTAHTSHNGGPGGSSVIDNRADILGNLSGNSPRSIDVFRHTDSANVNSDGMKAMVREIMGTGSSAGTYGLDGVCSNAARQAVTTGAGLSLDAGSGVTPQSLSRDSNLQHVGTYNTERQQSELPRAQ